MQQTNAVELSPEDFCFVNEEFFYTRSGAMKTMLVKSTTLSKEVRDGNIEVFKHPIGDLFSKPAISAWMIKRTKRARR